VLTSIRLLRLTIFFMAIIPPVAILAAGGKLLPILGKQAVQDSGENKVRFPCLRPPASDIIDFGLERKSRWSLPEQALSPNFLDTLKILVLRFNFPYETTDDPHTTGRGRMDLSDPLANPTDSANYYNAVGHLVDPPPHDSQYFDAHMRALRKYYETVSGGKLTLTWDIYPTNQDSTYLLPYPMSYYGTCDFDSVVTGLERYFIDCIKLVDTIEPAITFADYRSIFLFHAGSDRQNDIGFPETCNDLFSGFISFGDSLGVDNNTHFVKSALILPETACQDNRGTALNAVIAHEFGHQLGLVDLYNTRNFLSQLGDFELMDDNGFGTGIDFGFKVGQVFGAIPLYPSAWSRAFLGFVNVVDFRQDADLRVVAAEVVSNGIKIARVPISENEYYLIENRLVDTDGKQTALLEDSATSVFQYPVDLQKKFTGEYDFLMPGSGLLIYLVDEAVASLDYDNNGVNNFYDNELQWDPKRKFVTLIEADGIIDFGGYYRSGYGSPGDMYRDDRNTSFTANTNPPSIDNSGNNTRVRITDISRDTATTVQGLQFYDSVITAKLEIDGKAAGFPVRAGHPVYGLNPLAADLDKNGTPELIVASGTYLNVVTLDGQNFLRQITNCTTCPTFVDTAYSSVSTGVPYTLPLYAHTFGAPITASPVVGDFGQTTDSNYIAIGTKNSSTTGNVLVYRLSDVNKDGIADFVTVGPGNGIPVALSFGSQLWSLRDNGLVERLISSGGSFNSVITINNIQYNDQYHGIAQLGNSLILLAGDSLDTKLYYITTPNSADSIALGGYYTLGPVVADMNLDGLPELVTFTADGIGLLLTIDTTVNPPTFSFLLRRGLNTQFTTNPVISDVDLDGYPDIIIGGLNAVYAFNSELLLKTDFPIQPSDEFVRNDVIAAPITADIQTGEVPEIVFPTIVGNIYSFGKVASTGFPLSAGELGAGSPVYTSDGTTGKLGFLGADGWFYLWDMDKDTTKQFWPMGGHDPAGTYVFNQNLLLAPKPLEASLPQDKFYSYPNPVTNGSTTIRYFLGEDANSVSLKIFDLSGQEISTLTGTTIGGTDNEIIWNCNDVTPGVYRCVIEALFNGPTKTAFTDIAVIR